MEPLTNLLVIRDLLARHGFTFSKALGQNFIVNPSVCPRISQLGGAAPGVGVLEIGAGIGVLTTQLSKDAEKVVCVEIDSRLLPILGETLADCPNVTIVNADVMKTDLRALIAREFQGMEVAVCANLPYYITSPILMRLLEEKLPVRSITVMVQKEAARRICALPGTREAGAISAAVRYYSEPKILFSVSRGSFLPSPDVDSAVIRLDVLPSPAVAVERESLYFQAVRGAFSQRRKTVHNAVASYFHLTKDQAGAILESAGIAPGARAEQLGVAQFGALADALARAGLPG